MSLEAIEAPLRQLVDRQAIHEALMRYCRGVDRCDPELINSAFHPDAIDEHQSYRYTGTTVGPEIVKRMLAISRNTMHYVSNVRVDVDGSMANSESYYFACLASDDGPDEVVRQSGGRYVDRFECRHGDWRIAHRFVVHEWRITVRQPRQTIDPNIHVGLRTRQDLSYH